MTIAVTGASGFVGRHVLQALAARGSEDIVAVSRSAPDGLPPGVRHVALDIATAGAADYARLGRPDVLMHLAWGGLPNYRSLHHIEHELPMHYGFLRAMVDAGLPALLVAGTCYEYGMVDGMLAEDRPTQPANPYGYAKAGLLRQLEFLQTERPFALCWARLFYMWGPGQAANSLYPMLRAAAERGDRRFPMSHGEQLRDYLPVGEAAHILAELASIRADAGIVNVCSGEPVSIRALVERWIADAGWAIEPELGRYPYPSHEPLAFWGSAAKRRAVLTPLQGGETSHPSSLSRARKAS